MVRRPRRPIAHVVLQQSAVFDLRGLQVADDPVEQVGNRIAAEFLLPAESFRLNWSQQPTISLIARRFKVSELVVARRALDLGLLTRQQFFDFYDEYQNRERRRHANTGGSFYPTVRYRTGLRFSQALLQAVREGTTLYSEAYRLTSLKATTFESYARFVDQIGKDR